MASFCVGSLQLSPTVQSPNIWGEDCIKSVLTLGVNGSMLALVTCPGGLQPPIDPVKEGYRVLSNCNLISNIGCSISTNY